MDRASNVQFRKIFHDLDRLKTNGKAGAKLLTLNAALATPKVFRLG